MADGERMPVMRSDIVHDYFGLTYASYQVLPRVLMQEMPEDWQRRFVELMREADDLFEWPKSGSGYVVQLRDERTGRFVHDPLSRYRRPDWQAVEKARRRPSPSAEREVEG